MIGIGTDLVDLDRFREALARTPGLVPRLFCADEQAYAERRNDPTERYAARFAAKEAGMKAIGTGWRGGIRWQDFEVSNLPSGRPTLRFHGVAADHARRLGVTNVQLSLTHTADLGMAFVILEA